MMRDDTINSDNYLVRTEIIGVKHIPILYVCSTDNNKSKEFLVDENLSQVYSTDEYESKSVIVDEISAEDSE